MGCSADVVRAILHLSPSGSVLTVPRMTTNRLWLCLVVVAVAGCAKNADGMYANLSAGSTGCEPAQMAISADANPYAWKVTCQGKTFSCISTKGAPQGPAICTAE